MFTTIRKREPGQENARAGRFSGPGGWLAVLAGFGILIVVIAPSRDETDSATEEADRPEAQTSSDDLHSPVWSLAFSPDGTRLASATVAGEVWVRDVAAGRRDLIRRGPMSSSQSLAYSPDGRTLAVAGGAPDLHVVDLVTGELINLCKGVGDRHSRYVAFSDDGKYFASGGFGGGAALWDWSARRPITDLEGHSGGINALAFSPDGSTLATADSAGLVKLWSVPSGRERATVKAHEPGTGVTALAFSPDGQLLVTASYLEGVVRLWDPGTGAEQGTLPRTTSGVRAMAFSRDGSILALADGDGRARLWAVKEGREVASVRANARGLQSVAITPDGRALATGGTDGRVRLWDLDRVLHQTGSR